MKKIILILVFLIICGMALVACSPESYRTEGQTTYRLVNNISFNDDKSVICVSYDVEPSFWKDLYILECFKITSIEE